MLYCGMLSHGFKPNQCFASMSKRLSCHDGYNTVNGCHMRSESEESIELELESFFNRPLCWGLCHNVLIFGGFLSSFIIFLIDYTHGGPHTLYTGGKDCNQEIHLALEPIADITKSSKHRYQWPHKRDLWPSKNVLKTRKSSCMNAKGILSTT